MIADCFNILFLKISPPFDLIGNRNDINAYFRVDILLTTS